MAKPECTGRQQVDARLIQIAVRADRFTHAPCMGYGTVCITRRGGVGRGAYEAYEPEHMCASHRHSTLRMVRIRFEKSVRAHTEIGTKSMGCMCGCGCSRREHICYTHALAMQHAEVVRACTHHIARNHLSGSFLRWRARSRARERTSSPTKTQCTPNGINVK